ncbi:autotransporter outer membrane beta-barrel domain-containing protein [Bradyrhizobium sp. ORS 86]|uniref:autotransporter family protein n=1 Tax=Bradyrhizobium sp. ORS 86 TaxID=1685970 RepID=UPI0038902CD1
MLLGVSSLALGLPLAWTTPAMAGCSNANPGSNTTVVCDANPPNPDTTGVQTQPGATNVTVTVNSGASLVTSGVAVLGNTSISNFTNNGSIQTGPNSTNFQTAGMEVIGNSNALTNAGKIEALGQGFAGGLAAYGNSNSLTNAAGATIITHGADTNGMQAQGNDNTITNNGTITTLGNVGGGLGPTPIGFDAEGDRNKLINNGTINTSGNFGIGMFATGTAYGIGSSIAITNAGIINTAGSFAWGMTVTGNNSTVTNTGAVKTTGDHADGVYVNASNQTAVINRGTISVTGAGAIGVSVNYSTAGQTNTITNQAGGVISSQQGYAIAALNNNTGNEIVDNSGTLIGGNGTAVALGSGNDALTVHAGSVVQGAMDGGTGTDTLTFDKFAYTGGSGIQNWETFNLSNGSTLTLNSDLVMGDLGGFAGDPNATKTGVVSIDTASAINAFGIYAIKAIDPSSLVTVNNAGTLNLSNGSATNVLTIVGNYVGQNGHLILSTVLGSDNSPSDKLVISRGTATGNTSITVNNAGGLGALTTGDGIRVVQAINGATTAVNAFALSGRVAAGAYDYLLYRSGATTPDDWYLRSTRAADSSPPTQPAAPGQPASPPADVPNYRPEVPLYMAVPDLAHQFGFAMIGSLHDRIGDEDPAAQPAAPARPVVPSTVWCKNPSKNFRCNVPSQQDGVYVDANSRYASYGAWARVFGETGRHREGSFWDGKGPDYDYGLAGFQAGIDLYRRELADGSRDAAGFFVGAGHAQGNVNHIFGGPAGHMSLDGYSAGGYWTHYGVPGWYIDAAVQGTRFDNVVARSILFQSIQTDGWGLTASLEAGKAFQLGNGWAIEPQAQLVYQRVSLSGAADAFGLVQFADSDAVRGRIGARLARTFAISADYAPRLLTTWTTVNVWHGFTGDPKTTFADLQGLNAVTLSSKLGGTWAQVQAGITGQVYQNVAVFTSADYNVSIDSGGSTSFGGRAGIKVVW